MKRILIAGIGNIFLGDDAFGVEVAQALSRRSLPSEVQVTDFGIRSYDLAQALSAGYETVIMVDATPQGDSPGTLYLVEPDLEQLDCLGNVPIDGHSMNPMLVLQLARSMGGGTVRLYLLGCEPAEFGAEGGHFGLSDPMQAAVPKAVEMIESLVGDLLDREELTTAGHEPEQTRRQ